jgi:excisionase family DNA binding protein
MGYLLSVSELAKVLNRDASTLHKLIREGRLPFEVIDTMGVRQVRRTDVEAFLRLPPGALAEAS